MRPPCVEPSQIGSFTENTEIRATQVLVLSDNSGGSRISQTGEGSQPIIWPNFHENCIKMGTIKPKGWSICSKIRHWTKKFQQLDADRLQEN